MVGESKRQIGRIRPDRFAGITGRLVGRAYALGGCATGCDCFSLVYLYLQELSLELPDEFEGLTLETYAARFEQDPDGAKEVMVRFISSLLPELEPRFAFAGDLLLLRLRGEEDGRFLGIHGGGTNVICATREDGVAVYPLQGYKILRAWKCQRHPRR